MTVKRWIDNRGHEKFTVKYGNKIATFDSECEATRYRLAIERETLNIEGFQEVCIMATWGIEIMQLANDFCLNTAKTKIGGNANGSK